MQCSRSFAVGGTQINAGEKWKLVEKGFSEEVGGGEGRGVVALPR